MESEAHVRLQARRLFKEGSGSWTDACMGSMQPTVTG